MINKGLILEVKEILYNFGEDVNVVLQTVGYKETIKHLKSEITLDEMIEEIKKNTRRYAKRQMTWFRKDKNINWIDVNDESEFEKIADYIIEKISGGINER
jgi:tRNA dimethylallyltransferase